MLQLLNVCSNFFFTFLTCQDWTKAFVMKWYRLRLFLHKSDLHFARGWSLFVHPHPDRFWIGQPVDRVQGGSKLEISSRPDSSSYRCHLWQVVIIVIIIRRRRMVMINKCMRVVTEWEFRREIYNDLLTKFGAKADLMDMSGQVSLWWQQFLR